jgi:hypothetical protein
MRESNNFEHRKSERDCFCRGCDKKIKRNSEDIIYTYSFRNKGQSIIFCEDCVQEMFKLCFKFEVFVA